MIAAMGICTGCTTRGGRTRESRVFAISLLSSRVADGVIASNLRRIVYGRQQTVMRLKMFYGIFCCTNSDISFMTPPSKAHLRGNNH